MKKAISSQEYMNPCALKDWLAYLESFQSGLNNPELARTRKIAQSLSLLPVTTKVITVTGTNGKGSCVAFLEAIMLAAGLRVGAYTSPHVLRYNERIRVNGIDASDAELIAAFTSIEEARGENALSFFEFSTLAAFWLFQQKQLDVLILEVGVGGRFDPVNILDPDVAVITTVALDHTQILGSTRAAILREKAGIMRKHRPVVCGDPNPPNNIFALADEYKAILYLQNRDFSFTFADDRWSWYCNADEFINLPLPKLPVQNAATALMVIKLLQSKLDIPPQAIIQGINTAVLTGRYQKISLPGKGELILDVAHNPEAAELLAQKLKQEKIEGKLVAVMSMFQDKDITTTLKHLIPLIEHWYIGKLHHTRAASADFLTNCLRDKGVSQITLMPTISAAMQQAIAESTEIDKILTFGSFHTVAEVLEWLNGDK